MRFLKNWDVFDQCIDIQFSLVSLHQNKYKYVMDPLPQKNLYWMVMSTNWYFILFSLVGERTRQGHKGNQSVRNHQIDKQFTNKVFHLSPYNNRPHNIILVQEQKFSDKQERCEKQGLVLSSLSKYYTSPSSISNLRRSLMLLQHCSLSIHYLPRVYTYYHDWLMLTHGKEWMDKKHCSRSTQEFSLKSFNPKWVDIHPWDSKTE